MLNLSPTLKAMSDPTRLKILKLVSTRELCVCEITDVLGVTSSCVSQHLSKLRAAGLVRERRDAQWVYYSIDPERIKVLSESIMGIAFGPLETFADMEEGEKSRLHALDPVKRAQLCKKQQ